MNTKVKIEVDFHFKDDGAIKINQGKLIDFLEAHGFLHLEIGKKSILVRNINNILYRVSKKDIVELVRNTLDVDETREVYDTYAKSPGTYTGWNKLELLKSTQLIDDRDDDNMSRFYFANCYCEITENDIVEIPNEKLSHPIWQNRIIDRNYNEPACKKPGQFEVFCNNISGNSPERFKAMKSFLGYLLHRNKERGEHKAVILYDEKMGVGGTANGRTGKTLLANALKQCRETEKFDGRYLKNEGNFKNQRINLTSDILVYDDLQKNIKFDIFYSMLTTGIEVEKKGQQSFYIEDENAPKILITSNHYVNGDGGDSDKGRRYEFEIVNYYSLKFKPEHEFGNRFFGKKWPVEEWDKFYFFMFQCVQIYLSNGLIEVPDLNLTKSKILDNTSPEFLEFAEEYFELNSWLDKREYLEFFQGFYPKYADLSSKQFTSWSKQYAVSIKCVYEDKSSGCGLFFKLNPEN
ncbi:primase-helicase family protein [Christiangramia echinicola]|uniref:primase-helicase family protein n=1 Tax=Christiangramia echinicola TaxID=279359 RepID=UPI0003F81241|nr:primase-helicase family protein [Christiangramia echinicola]